MEERESARELTWNVEVEVEDLDITRIAHMVQVKNEIKEERKWGCGIHRLMFKRGLTSKEGKSRLWSGWEAKRERIHSRRGCVIDGQVDTG